MSSTSRPIPTYRSGTIMISPRNKPPQCHVNFPITSQHVKAHSRTVKRENLPTDISLQIVEMEDGGPVPNPGDFFDGCYVGTEEYRQGFRPGTWFTGAFVPEGIMLMQSAVPTYGMPAPMRYFPQAQTGPMSGYPTQGIQAGSGFVPQGALQIPQPARAPRPPFQLRGDYVHQEARRAVTQACNSQRAVVMEDGDFEAQIVNLAPLPPALVQEEVQVKPATPFPRTPTPPPKTPSPPSRPCHLQECIRHLKKVFTGACHNAQEANAWLVAMRNESYNFMEAYLERKFVEVKKAEGLDWEHDGRAIEAQWAENIRNGSAVVMKRKKDAAQKKKDEENAKRMECSARNNGEEAAEAAPSRKRKAVGELEPAVVKDNKRKASKKQRSMEQEETVLPSVETLEEAGLDFDDALTVFNADEPAFDEGDEVPSNEDEPEDLDDLVNECADAMEVEFADAPASETPNEGDEVPADEDNSEELEDMIDEGDEGSSDEDEEDMALPSAETSDQAARTLETAPEDTLAVLDDENIDEWAATFEDD
ncbi:hypothetical protein BU23DRAFT_569033 [Bimuria novae-zelandiae CBS 107.79]|uniref:Uncharacterized protein n=1 Tax=Bimuria novae-zelandiae CBS 107.79 TaxID=1447943 RepID=A0A6A5V5U5_9PLEO|nr:hypothetical protein BU23DRAFT_569033 [Bimuria novae-zelandiae CBS 107.79]